MADEAKVEVTRNEAESRFETTVDGQLALLTYDEQDGQLALLHTEVPQALEGRGIGSKIVEHALDHARAEGQKVLPFCRFVKAYIDRHKDYQDLVADTF